MRDSANYKKPWTLPILATIAFLLLLTHKSEFPVVFNRYSLNYTIILFLLLMNLVLFWRSSFRKLSYKKVFQEFRGRHLVVLFLLTASVAFLVDFAMGPSQSTSDWIILGLLAGSVVQGECLAEKRATFTARLALVAVSLVIAVCMVELLFAFFLLETCTPKTRDEFLQLMSSSWPEAISEAKPSGRFRILGLSDSFGTAGGSSNYHYILPNILPGDLTRNIQMLNVSVSAYEPPHQLAILRFALPYLPDLVIHGFFVGNDFSLRDNEMYTFRGIFAYREQGASPYRPHNFFIRSWIENALKFIGHERRLRVEKETGTVGQIGSMPEERFLKLQFNRMKEWGTKDEKNIARLKKILPVLDAIRAAVKQVGAQYVMVIHPDETQVDSRLRRQIIRRYSVNESDYDFDLPQKVLKLYCREQGMSCLDLLPVFRMHSAATKLYLLRDTHYNETGNRLAADSIRRFLIEEGLLPTTGASTLVQKRPEP